MAVDIGEIGGTVTLEDEASPALESLASAADDSLESFRGMSEGLDSLIDQLGELESDMTELEASIQGAAGAGEALGESTGAAAEGAKDLDEEQKKVNFSLTEMIGGMSKFGGVAGEVLKVTIGLAGALAAAVAGVVAGIVALGMRGSDVADIRDAFNRLTQEAGLTKDVLNTLRTATDGVITDFDLMQSTNRALGAGLRLTNEQFAQLGEGARQLADDTGRDAKEAFDALLTAMETGRVRGLRGWQIDTVTLQDKIRAAGQGLSQYEKQQIAVAGIMEELARKTKITGGVQLDFADQIKASTNLLLNFKDEVAFTVSELPAFAVILDTIRKAIESALGADQVERAETLRKFLNQVALALVDAARVAASFGIAAIGAFQHVINFGVKLVDGIYKIRIAFLELDNLMRFGDPHAELIKNLEEDRKALHRLGQAAYDGAEAARNGLANIQSGLDPLQAAIVDAMNKPAKAASDAGKDIKQVNREIIESEQDKQKAVQAAAAAMKEAVAAADANRSALEALGIVTATTVNEAMNDWNRIINQGVKEGVPLEKIIKELSPKMFELAEAAMKSGVNIDLLQEFMKSLNAQAKTLESTSDLVSAQFKNMAPLAGAVTDQLDTQQITVEDLNEAYKFFGINTPANLQKAADAAERNFLTLQASGTATTDQLKRAYQQMIDAQVAASGRLPSVWETEIVPSIKSAMDTLQSSITGTFAQMLLGVEGFASGWKEIWESIKKTAMNIFNQIAEAFIGGMIKKMVGALTGAGGGGFGSLFQGAFSGIGGLFGGGGAGLPIPGTFTTSLPGLPGAAGAAGGLGGILSGILGGAGAGAGGILLGQLGRNLFGEGAGAAAFGGLSGAAQGALIGSIVPGIGTAVGAIIGGLSGVISSFFGGPSAAEKEGRGKVAAFEDFLASTLNQQQLIEAGGESWKATVIALRDQYIAMGRTEQEALADAERLWASSRDGGEDTLAVIADIQQKLETEVPAAAATAAEAVGPQITEAAEAAATAVGDATAAVADAAEKMTGKTEEEAIKLKAQVEETARAMEEEFRIAAEATAGSVGEAVADINETLDKTKGKLDLVNGEVRELSRGDDQLRPFEDVLSDIRDGFQDAADAAHDLTDAIDDIPRNVDIDVNVGGDDIPRAAEGGITTGPTIAGEAGREAIIPLDRLAEFGFGAANLSGVESRLDVLNSRFSYFAAQQPILTSRAVRDAMRGAG